MKNSNNKKQVENDKQNASIPNSITDFSNNEPKLKKYKDKIPIVNVENYLNDNFNIRMNEISHDIEYKRIDENEYKILNINDLSVELIKAEVTRNDRDLKILLSSSFVTKYNPLRDYFESLPPFDPNGEDYIKKLASYIKTDDDKWFLTQFRKMFVRVIRNVYHKGFNKQMFVLTGTQDDGKTSFVRFLMPPELNNGYFKEGIEVESKEGDINVCRNMIINIEELAEFERKYTNRIKALLSSDYVKKRLVFGQKDIPLRRIASFFGTTNESDFLKDVTGSVRFLVFSIKKIKHDRGGENGYSKNIDINQVWSQAYHLYKNGFDGGLTPAELEKSELRNKSYSEIIGLYEVLIKHLKPSIRSNPNSIFMQFHEIMNYIIRESDAPYHIRINENELKRALIYNKFEKVQKRTEVTDKHGKKINQPRQGYYVIKISEKKDI
ncbi:MAG: hypothetical protein IPL95_11580 [Saprospiraceae bacterium]|nr:hypothetical protein [Saprospiraceae bacterium]